MSEAQSWWARVPEYKIGSGYRYAGAKKKSETGTMRALPDKIEYKSLIGSRVKIPWTAIRELEISTEPVRKVTAGRAVAIGALSLAAKKTVNSVFVHVTDKYVTWTFESGRGLSDTVKEWRPILDAWQARPEQLKIEAPAEQQGSTADEIRKLGELRAEGLLSDEEFEAQKAKILG